MVDDERSPKRHNSIQDYTYYLFGFLFTRYQTSNITKPYMPYIV